MFSHAMPFTCSEAISTKMTENQKKVISEKEQQFIRGVIDLLHNHPEVLYKIDTDKNQVYIEAKDTQLQLQLGTTITALRDFYGVE